MNEIELIKKYVSSDKQQESLKKLKDGYPVQYIIGNVDFFGNQIIVNENVLIPRFETEYLVEKTINFLKKKDMINPKVLEIGTGSGCISMALKKLVNCEIDAIDISYKALEVAKTNAQINNVSINFIEQDINDYTSTVTYDLIISNPPYVKYDKNVAERLKYEPQNAIFAPNDGIFFYDIILNKIKNNLNTNFLIAFEIDDKQGEVISKLAVKYLGDVNIFVEKDYHGLERYLFITNK